MRVARWRRTPLGLWAVGTGMLLGTIGCQTPIEVYSAYGAGWDLAGLGSSFDWGPAAEEAARNVCEVNPSLHSVIREEIENGLVGRGYRKVEDAEPDFWVQYRVTRELLPDPEAAQPFAQYAKGSLFLDAIKPETATVVWRASAQTRMDPSATPEQRESRLREAVQRMVGQLEKARN